MEQSWQIKEKAFYIYTVTLCSNIVCGGREKDLFIRV